MYRFARAGIPAAYRKPFPVRHAEQPEKLFKALGFFLFRTGDPLRHRHQLSQPVSEALRGVDYVNEWLRRLCLEQAFLDCFDPVLIRTVLEQSCPDYRNLLINLYEPVAVNALGLAILGDDPRTLSIPASRWQKLKTALPGCRERRLRTRFPPGQLLSALRWNPHRRCCAIRRPPRRTCFRGCALRCKAEQPHTCFSPCRDRQTTKAAPENRRRFLLQETKTKNRSISPAHASWRSTRCNRPDGRTWAQREPWPRRRRQRKQR